MPIPQLDTPLDTYHWTPLRHDRLRLREQARLRRERLRRQDKAAALAERLKGGAR